MSPREKILAIAWASYFARLAENAPAGAREYWSFKSIHSRVEGEQGYDQAAFLKRLHERNPGACEKYLSINKPL